MNKPITKNIIFRLIFPVIFGLLAYLIVLMIFDNVPLILDNFFSKEVAFFIVLSFAVFESLLFVFYLLEKHRILENRATLKLILFIFTTIITSTVIVSLLVSGYFILIENTNVYNTELVAFNFIMLFASLSYLTIFYSIGLISKQAKKAISLEILEKENIDKRLKLLQSKVRPEILYESLEILIDLIHEDEKQAEKFINQLSAFYRNIIEERHIETIPLKQEIIAANNLIDLLNNKYNGRISLHTDFDYSTNYQIIPGIIQQIVFASVQKNIISENLPLQVKLKIANKYLLLSYFCHERLTTNISEPEQLGEMINKYKIYSERKIKETKNETGYSVQIPLLSLETV